MAEFNEIFIQKIVQLLQDSTWTSANPIKTNYVKDIREVRFGNEFNAAFEAAVIEAVEEYLAQNPPEAKEEIKITPKKKGLTEARGIGIAKQTLRGVQDPASLVAMGLRYLPHAALIAFAISLAPLIFDILIRPGGPFDVRFKRIVDDEINAFLARQTQKDTEFGYRQVIIQSKIGFTAPNGVNNYNTVRGIREGGLDKERLARIGMVDHTKGDWWPFG